MAQLTGSPEVDYILTIVFSLIQGTLTKSINYIQLFLVTYPDIAGIILIVIGITLLFFIIKNILTIIYNLIISTLKVLLVISVLFVGAWIYIRGVNHLLEDSKILGGYISELDGSLVKAAYGRVSYLKSTYDSLVQFAKEVAHDEL